MNYKLLIKRLALLFIALCLFIITLFSIFIAPNRTLPILMYHSITSARYKNSALTLPQDIFKKQMEYLSKHDYYVASLKDVARMMREGKDIPRNWVVLTFDDGFRDFYDNAYPILKKHRFNATAFVDVDCLGKSQNSLNWKEVEQLAQEDLIDIGAHSLSHRILPLLAPEEAKKEVFHSKLIIEEKLKEPVISFAYPYGAVDDSIKEMVKEAGYEAAVGTAYQRGQFKNNDIHILKRVFVSRLSMYPFAFRSMISGYYVAAREFILRVLNIRVPRVLYEDERVFRLSGFRILPLWLDTIIISSTG